MNTFRKYERVDLGNLKNKLSSVLKDDAHQYWDVFKNFLQAKTSKHDFDTVARRVLGEENCMS
jgi:hypothetical protein